MDETFTETELRNALTDLGWGPNTINRVIRDLKPTQITREQLLSSLTINETSPAAKTGTVMSRIAQLRRRKDSQTPFDSQTITRAELKKALSTVLSENGYAARLSFSKAYFSLSSLVNDLFRDAAKPSEPGYQAGHVYRDKSGELWRREPGSMWTKFGSQINWEDETPTRPLTEVTT